MSRGPGTIEARIGDLFAANRDRALSVDELVAHAFALDGERPTRAQRLSAIRAAHRVIRRCRELDEKVAALRAKARRNAGTEPEAGDDRYEYRQRLEADPHWREADRLREAVSRIGVKRRWRREAGGIYVAFDTGYWQATTQGCGRGARLWFHPPDVPVEVWAVEIDPHGVHWFDAELVRVTRRNVMVRYAGGVARLDREKLWRAWAWWRGVRFVSSRSGTIAGKLEEIWWERYGAEGLVPPAMQMPLGDAMRLLGVPLDYTREDVITAYRRAAKKAHPDLGGTADDFRKLVEARDRLLAALGTRAPPPKMPAYYPSGTPIAYRSRRRLGQTRRLAETRRLARGAAE